MRNDIFEFVSVIVPTYNDPNGLERCLEALASQTYPQERFEIIVVDNGSSFNIKPIADNYKNARYLLEAKTGSYAARNRGIIAASGEILAFTDSDTIPENTWLERGVHHLLSSDGCGLIAGAIKQYYRIPNQPNVFELYESVVSHKQKYYIESKSFGATANLFTYKNVFQNVGLFNKNLKSRGDVEWGQRVYSHGYALNYVDDAIVWHPARNSLAQIYHRNMRLVGGRIDYKKEFGEPLISLRYFANLILPPLREIITDACMNSGLKNIREKISTSMVMILVHYIISFETIRLLIGGSSKR